MMMLIGGVDAWEFVTLLLGPVLSILALVTPFFGVRQVKENAQSYAHHFVISGAFITAGLGLAVFRFSAFALMIIAANGVWFISARGAARRAHQRRRDDPDASAQEFVPRYF